MHDQLAEMNPQVPAPAAVLGNASADAVGATAGPVAAGADAAPAARGERARVRRGIVCTLVGGTFWGLNGTVASWLMNAYSVDPLWLVCFRELTACWLFLAAAALTPKGRGQLAGVVRSRKGLLEVLAVAFGAILFSQVAYLQAIHWTSSAMATIMQSLGMALVLGWTCLSSRRGPAPKEAIGLALALAGTFLVATGGNPGQLDLPVMGLVWGLVCALSSACLSVLPAKPMARWGNFTVNGIAFLVSGSVLAAVYRPWEHMPALDVAAVAALVFIVLIGTFGSYALFLQGVHDAGSMRASLLGTSEPIAATISTVLLLGTALSPADLLGFAFILAMVYLTA